MTKRIEMRQSFEDEFARQLRSRGVEAATCHECIPDPDKVTREELIKVSQGMGIEAYLIVRVLRVGTEVQSYQGQSPSPMAATTGMDSMVNMTWFGPEPSMGKRSDCGNAGVEDLRREDLQSRLAIHRRCRQPVRERRACLPVRQPDREDPWRSQIDRGTMKERDEPMRGWSARTGVILLAVALTVAAAPLAFAAQAFVEFSVPACQ